MKRLFFLVLLLSLDVLVVNARYLCNATERENQGIFPSWCYADNPFTNPFPTFSDQNLTRLGTRYTCDGSGMNAECSVFRKMRTTELVGVDETGEPFPVRMVTFAMNTGEVAIASFNADRLLLEPYMAHEGQQIIEMESLVLENAGYLSTASEKAIRLDVAIMGVESFFGSCMYYPLSESQGSVVKYRLVELDHMRATAPGWGVIAGLVLVRDDTHHFVVHFFGVPRFCGWDSVFKTQERKSSKKGEWAIPGSTDEWSLGVFVHQGNLSGGQIESERAATLQQPLLYYWSASRVYIVGFDPTVGNITLNSASSNEFYHAETGRTITAVHVWSEKLRRIRGDGDTKPCDALEGYPSANVWLVVATVGEDAGDGSLVEFISLTEFLFVDYTATGTPLEWVMDPAQRLARGVCPSWKEWKDPDTLVCQTRNIVTQQVPGKVMQLKSAFRSLPPESPPLTVGLLEHFNETNCEHWKSYPVFYEECIEAAREANKERSCKELLTNTSLVNQMLSQFLYTNVFGVTSSFGQDYGRQTFIWGLQPEFFSTDGAKIEHFNHLSFLGRVLDVDISSNSMHLFATVTRELWEIKSFQRFGEICALLEKNPKDVFLESYRDSCKENPPVPFDLNYFGQFASLCPPGTWCPSLAEQEIRTIPDGWYTIRPERPLYCDPGHFCIKGQRTECPFGFVCGDQGMTAPTRCDFPPLTNKNCFGTGLVEEQPCASGALCLAPYFPPLPSPPGFYVPVGTNDLVKCKVGEWCSLGRYSRTPTPENPIASDSPEDLRCPEITYCQTPDVIKPSMCSTSEDLATYCPAGSSEERLCPAGEYCWIPNVSAPCLVSAYCPAGSRFSAPCDPGFYCPSPKTRVECPAGFFCRAGAIVPTKCPPLAVCPAGTKSETSSYAGALTDVLLCLVFYVGYKVFVHIRDKKRDQRESVRMATMSSGSATEALLVEGESNEYHIILEDEEGGEQVDNEFTMDVRFQDLGLTLKNGRSVLQGVTGELVHGKVTAIMGPSGAGKTTFLSVLAGKAGYGKVSGKMWINGVEDELSNHQKLLGFVPQDDVMLRSLSCKEILLHSCSTRCDRDVSRAEREAIVDKALEGLGLMDLRHNVIGDEKKRGISGGQRKRVNIGMELVIDPKVLLLDEPTSGLDSTSSMEVIQVLKRAARQRGMLVALVLHQPRFEIFTMFDTILLLGKGGRTVYLGPSEKAVEYFEGLGFEFPPRVNPADHMMDIIAGKVQRKDGPEFSPHELPALWNERVRPVEEEEEREKECQSPPRRVTPGFLWQLWLYFQRALVQQSRDGAGLFIDALLVVISGAALGMIYFQTFYVGPPPKEIANQCPGPMVTLCSLPVDDPIVGMASFSLMAMGLTAVMASLRVFGPEQIVFRRETESGTNRFSYFLGKNLSQIPNIILAPLLFLTVFYQLTTPRAKLSQWYGVLLAAQFAATGFAYLISIAVPSGLAQLVGVVFVLVCQLYSGARPTLSMLSTMFFPMPILPFLSYIRFAQEALYLVEIEPYTKVYDVASGMNLWSYSFDDLGMCVSITILFGLLARMLAFAALVWKNRA